MMCHDLFPGIYASDMVVSLLASFAMQNYLLEYFVELSE